MDFKHKYTGSLPIAKTPETEFDPKNGTFTISPWIVGQKQIVQFGNSVVNLPKPWRVLIPSFQIEWKFCQLILLSI